MNFELKNIAKKFVYKAKIIEKKQVIREKNMEIMSTGCYTNNGIM